MHRHFYQGKKLSRNIGQRKALTRSLTTSLILYETITTTYAKAKEIIPIIERLISKAKEENLHARRQIRSLLLTEKAAKKLMQEIAPLLKTKKSGYIKIVRLTNRLGDNAPMAALSLDLPIKPATKNIDSEEKKNTSKLAAATKGKSNKKLNKSKTRKPELVKK